jgi:hypothetical protein
MAGSEFVGKHSNCCWLADAATASTPILLVPPSVARESGRSQRPSLGWRDDAHASEDDAVLAIELVEI